MAVLTGIAGPSAAALEVPVLKTGPKTIWDDYQRNEVAADNLYRNHRLSLIALVTNIRKDAFQTITLDLAATQTERLQARFNEQWAAQVGQLDKGEIVQVTCVGQGLVLGTPMLSQCSVDWSQPKEIAEQAAVLAASYELCALDKIDGFREAVVTGEKLDGGAIAKKKLDTMRRVVSEDEHAAGAARLPCSDASIEALGWCDGDWSGSTVCANSLLLAARPHLHHF